MIFGKFETLLLQQWNSGTYPG